MNRRILNFFCMAVMISLLTSPVEAQVQNQVKKEPALQDTTTKKKSPASKAALMSAILPGLGQVYNKKYWKLPLVYGVIAIPVSTFKYNREWYQKTRFAYSAKLDTITSNDALIARELQPLSNESLKLYRNAFRKNMDFSILGILVAWGLNVIDATVDGHLRNFDINTGLTMQIKPSFSSPQTPLGLSISLMPLYKKQTTKIAVH
jgi:Family of unknown function (DUF5683)